jgi:hypothetical protein
MTSPPQSVSVPRIASATYRPIASIDPSFNRGADIQTNVCATREVPHTPEIYLAKAAPSVYYCALPENHNENAG